MSETQQAPRKTSRLLAALDSSMLQLNGPLTTIPVAASSQSSLKRMSPVSSLPGQSYNKRQASGFGIHASIGELSTVTGSSNATYDSNDDINSDNSPPRRKFRRSTSTGGFGINFALGYDRESEVHQIDRADRDQALRMAEFVTRTIDNSTHGLTVQSAMENLGLQDKRDLLCGMEVRLLPHQIIGVSWMLSQERNTHHKGGILADDMGLGKTVQMIATMAMNMPAEKERNRTTLLVVPAALLTQWKEELETKTNDIFSIHVQHGKDKLKTVEALCEKDIVITTYQTLNMDFNIPKNVDSEDHEEWLAENGGPLARMEWYRVITDEAQFIRNRGTRSSLSCSLLDSRYRWCLTGTPVTNTLADIYGFLRFGHFRPWNVWEDFNSYIAKTQLEDAPLAGLRTQEILKPLLLRRTKNSTLEGRPILELPEKHVDIITVEFSKDEREIYDHVEQKAQVQINRFIKQNTIVKNHSWVLVLILRLRQLCCHPNLILSRDEAADDPAMVAADVVEKEYARAIRVMGIKWAIEIRKKFLERAKAALADYEEDELEAPEGECPVCNEVFVESNDNSGRVLACGHEVCFACLRELSTTPIVHDGIFGNGDDKKNMRIEQEYELAQAKGLRPCPTCKKMCDLTQSAVFRSTAFQPTSEDLKRATRRKYPGSTQSSRTSLPQAINIDEDSSSDEDLPDISTIIKNSKANAAQKDKGQAKGRRLLDSGDELSIDEDEGRQSRSSQNGKGKHSNMSPEPKGDTAPSKDVIMTWREGGENLEPSAKMLALIGFLQEWESTGDKTICFSQWTSMLDLVESLFNRYGIQSLRYDGSMKQEARESVLSRFRKPGGPKVILISTKCGGVGLNLTSANRIINLDLSWNYASESQAYDRVHRLGQEKEVFVKRLVVKDTIEERMLRLQETKTGLAEAALGEGSGVKLHKLSVKELKALFGMSKKDDDDANNANSGARPNFFGGSNS